LCPEFRFGHGGLSRFGFERCHGSSGAVRTVCVLAGARAKPATSSRAGKGKPELTARQVISLPSDLALRLGKRYNATQACPPPRSWSLEPIKAAAVMFSVQKI
jgi:hypothetical protein